MKAETDFRRMVGRPSAFVPVMMSLFALIVVAGYVAIYGTARQTDEGAAAHIWQLLVCAQVPVVAFFVVKWLPKAPRAGFCVLAMQLVALLIAATPVFILHL
jgi:hypothetical protein